MYLRVEKPICISRSFFPRKVQLLKCGFKTPPQAECSLITYLSHLVETCPTKGTRTKKQTRWLIQPVTTFKPTKDSALTGEGSYLLVSFPGPTDIRLSTANSKAGRFSVLLFVFLSQTLRIFLFINPSTLITWIRKNKFTSRFLCSVFLSTTWS